MRIMFMGTPEFANYSLDALIEEGYDVVFGIYKKRKFSAFKNFSYFHNLALQFLIFFDKYLD